MHLLVPHPYYAVSNTRMERPETASTRRGWRCGGRSMWELYAWEVFSLNQLVDPRRAQPTCQLNYLLLMNPCTDLILIFNPDLFFFLFSKENGGEDISFSMFEKLIPWGKLMHIIICFQLSVVACSY